MACIYRLVLNGHGNVPLVLAGSRLCSPRFFLSFFLGEGRGDRDRERTRKRREREDIEREFRGTRISTDRDAIFVKSFSARSYRTRRMQARNYRPFWTKPIAEYLFPFISFCTFFSPVSRSPYSLASGGACIPSRDAACSTFEEFVLESADVA